ncbi:MAG: D-2-hydroxyacid dehydrogenase [Bacteroidetes bacterium]|nr:MAG: D-2-hydroxyacid dehydrogenase [Bacteroidota bacterium]
MKKIVILDGHCVNPQGDLDWKIFEKFGKITYFDQTPPDLIVARAKDADLVLFNKIYLNKDVLPKLPKLKYIGLMSTGYDTVDLQIAKNQGITVCNVPSYSTDSVAQHTFALILALCNRVENYAKKVATEWSVCPYWCYWENPVLDLAGKTLGLIGFGQIGQKVAQIALAFGMKVIFYNRNAQNQSGLNVSYSNLDNLFASSDFVSLHCPLNDDNQGFMNKFYLEKMKSSAFLINTSRGKLIQETDLRNAILEGKIAGAGLDVVAQEPPPADHPLFNLQNCLITPHLAWGSLRSRQQLMSVLLENIAAFLEGKPQNSVI